MANNSDTVCARRCVPTRRLTLASYFRDATYSRDASYFRAATLAIATSPGRRLPSLQVLITLTLALAGSAPAPARELTSDPIKWFDADNKNIPEPAEIVENQVWDITDHTLFFQVGKLLDIGWTARRIGNIAGLAPAREADNVNALDETTGSSWYANRHFRTPMTIEELQTGPGEAAPDKSEPWEIAAGKFEGGTSGFTIKDAAGTYFLLKFDSEGNNEMGSSAEVIATKFLHAAGYNVPQNSVVYFDPQQLVIGPKAKVPTPDGGKRPMEVADMQAILDNIIPQPDGTLRCVASKFLTGKPVGIFDYHGRRADDANDRVDHEHRRELRGLRVIGSWMNDADRRAANTLDMWVNEEEGRRRYIKHYLIDMGSAFGSNNMMPHMPKYGNEYVWDPRTILRSIVSLGFYRKGWEEPQPMSYPSIGYFENVTFRPDGWVPTYPNPAFERCTNRDGYWGAKMVMSFGDEEIRAIVATGRLSNPGAAAELGRLLIERRDTIGGFWFERVNPLDHFDFSDNQLTFVDLAVRGGLAPAAESRYHVRTLDGDGNPVGPANTQGARAIAVDNHLTAGFHGFEIRSQRGAEKKSKATRVFFHKWNDGRLQLVAVERDS